MNTNREALEPDFDRCQECFMLVKPDEYHPYTACVLYKQLGQADKVRSCLDNVIAHARAAVAAPQGDADNLSTAVTEAAIVDHVADENPNAADNLGKAVENLLTYRAKAGLNTLCQNCQQPIQKSAINDDWFHIPAWSSVCVVRSATVLKATPIQFSESPVLPPTTYGSFADDADMWTEKQSNPAPSPVTPSLIPDQDEARLLTAEEIANIERFQRQRRKNPVAADAWLYVAEIDQLLTHIRLDREQLENEIFQDATDPTFATQPSARVAAEEIETRAGLLPLSLIGDIQQRRETIYKGFGYEHYAAEMKTDLDYALAFLAVAIFPSGQPVEEAPDPCAVAGFHVCGPKDGELRKHVESYIGSTDAVREDS